MHAKFKFICFLFFQPVINCYYEIITKHLANNIIRSFFVRLMWENNCLSVEKKENHEL